MIAPQQTNLNGPRANSSVLFALTLVGGGLAFSWLIASSFPGLYSPDSLEQLGQARTGQFTDMHPPMMAGFWHLLIRATGSEASLFWIHFGLLACAIVTSLYVCFRSKLVASMLLIPLVLISPAFINFAGVIWKDVGFAFAMLLAAGLLSLGTIHPRWRWPIAGSVLVLTFYAAGVRLNGLPAAVPLLMLAIYRNRRSRPRWVQVSLLAVQAAAAIGFLAVSVRATNYGLLRGEKRNSFYGIQFYDLAGILKRTGRDYFPAFAETKGPLSREAIASVYRTESVGYLFSPGKDGLVYFRLSGDPAARAEIQQAWTLAVASEPKAYLLHRAAVFKSLLGIGQTSGGWLPYLTGFADDSQRPGGPLATNLRRRMEAYLVGFIGTPVYLGWFWLLLAAATFIGALLLRTVPSASALGPIRMVLLATSASVCLYILPYFFVAPSSDFRYLYWPVVATHVQIAVLVGIVVQPRTWQKRRQEDPQAFLSSSQMD